LKDLQLSVILPVNTVSSFIQHDLLTHNRVSTKLLYFLITKKGGKNKKNGVKIFKRFSTVVEFENNNGLHVNTNSSFIQHDLLTHNKVFTYDS